MPTEVLQYNFPQQNWSTQSMGILDFLQLSTHCTLYKWLYRLLFLLHPGGHLRHGPVYRGVFVQVGQILTAEDRQRLRGVQRPRPKRQFTHLRRSRYLSALGKRPRPAGSWRTGVSVSTRLPLPGTWGRSAKPAVRALTPAGRVGGCAAPRLAHSLSSIRHGQHGGH